MDPEVVRKLVDLELSRCHQSSRVSLEGLMARVADLEKQVDLLYRLVDQLQRFELLRSKTPEG